MRDRAAPSPYSDAQSFTYLSLKGDEVRSESVCAYRCVRSDVFVQMYCSLDVYVQMSLFEIKFGTRLGILLYCLVYTLAETHLLD